jgi:hypothetical protein
MKRLNVPIFGLSVALVLFSALWALVIAPPLLYSRAGLIGSLNYESFGKVRHELSAPMEESRLIEEHNMRIIELEGPLNTLEMSTRAIDPNSGDLQFEKTSQIRFDPTTLQMEGSEALAFFPRYVERKDYRVKQFSYLPDNGALFRFQSVELIEGAEVYRFDFDEANLDWTDSFDYALEPEATIKARDWGSLWIYPLNGILIKHVEDWSAQIVGGKFDGLTIDVGRMWLSPDTISKQVIIAQNDRRTHDLYEWIIPISLLLIGLIVMVMSIRRGEEI